MNKQKSSGKAPAAPAVEATTLEKVQDQVHVIVDGVEARASSVKSRALDVKNDAMARGNAFVERSREVIRAHPLKSVGIAFGAAYFGGRLLRR